VSYAIRPAEAADVPQLTEIDKEAFPTNWPATPFRREIANGRISYMVAYQSPTGGQPHSHAPSESSSPVREATLRGLRGIWKRLGGLLQREAPPSPTVDDIVGFVSIAFMTDEAHITAIAVRKSLRGNSLGNLLLLASVELAMKRESRVVTLEVRVSNHVAQSLYTKYGFKQVGLRKGYYSDDREDAYIMTTDPISSPSYRESFQHLVEEYKARRGEVALALG
jgi:ribosomal-protein-alanine N-acetyltransferase